MRSVVRYAVRAGHALLFAVSVFVLLTVLPICDDFCEVSFSLAYSDTGENHCQVFYVDGDDNALRELPRRAVSGSGTFRFRMPCQSLKMLRIDYGTVPGEIRMTDFRCRGNGEFRLDGAECKSRHMASCRIDGDSLRGSSTHIDPFVEITPREPLPPRPDRLFRHARTAFTLLAFAIMFVLLGKRSHRACGRGSRSVAPAPC